MAVANGFNFYTSTSASEVAFEDLSINKMTRIMMAVSSSKEITNMILYLIETFKRNPSSVIGIGVGCAIDIRQTKFLYVTHHSSNTSNADCSYS
jgi:hypothetical protein